MGPCMETICMNPRILRHICYALLALILWPDLAPHNASSLETGNVYRSSATESVKSTEEAALSDGDCSVEVAFSGLGRRMEGRDIQ